MEHCQRLKVVKSEQPSGNHAATEAGPGAGLAARVLQAVSPEVLDQGHCRAMLIDIFYPDGPCCPHCGSTNLTPSQLQTFQRFGRIKCPDCARWFRPTTNTPIHGSYLTPGQLVMLASGLALGLNPGVIAGLVGVTAQTVRDWQRKMN